MSRLLKDDRILRQLPELKASMVDSLRFLDALPGLVWERLAVVCHPVESASSLRTKTMMSALTSQVPHTIAWKLMFAICFSEFLVGSISLVGFDRFVLRGLF